MHEGENSPARRAGVLPLLGQLIFFDGGFRRTKSPVVAQTQGYHLVCIWGIVMSVISCDISLYVDSPVSVQQHDT